MLKKILLLSAVCGTLVLANAQVTITQVNMPGVGYVVAQANDTAPTVSISAGGTNQTWNFTSLQNHSQDTTIFTNPNWTPFGSSYPSANLAIPEGNGGYIYLGVSSAGLDIIGFGDSSGGASFTPPQRFIAFPSNYLDVFNGSSKLFTMEFDTAGIGFDSIRMVSSLAYFSQIDAWGSVTTPLGSFNSQRQAYTEVSVDSLFLHYTANNMWQNIYATADTQVTYRWWTSDTSARFPIVEIKTDANNNVYRASYLLALPTPSGIESLEIPEAKGFPNPAVSDYTIIAAGHVKEAVIFDATGREIERVMFNAGKARINTAAYARGLYYYQAGNMKGKFLVGKNQ